MRSSKGPKSDVAFTIELARSGDEIICTVSRSLLQFHGQSVQVIGLAFERLRDPLDLTIGLVVAFLFNRLANARQCLCSIAGIPSRSVDQVLVPWTARQS